MSAQELGVRALKSGAIAGDVDRLTKDYISRHGYEEFVLHSTGHGIGIEVHESPRLSADSTETLKKGMVVTVEPGIYIPELGGVRIEDDCLVLEDGGWRISHI
jgi:Xaa-Pro aminopeptidase